MRSTSLLAVCAVVTFLGICANGQPGPYPYTQYEGYSGYPAPASMPYAGYPTSAYVTGTSTYKAPLYTPTSYPPAPTPVPAPAPAPAPSMPYDFGTLIKGSSYPEAPGYVNADHEYHIPVMETYMRKKSSMFAYNADGEETETHTQAALAPKHELGKSWTEGTEFKRCRPGTHICFTQFRNADGSFNNIEFPHFGSAPQEYLRQSPAAYTSSKADIVIRKLQDGKEGANARQISNRLHKQVVNVFSKAHLSAMIYAFGQFVDHDFGAGAPDEAAGDCTFTEPQSAAVPYGQDRKFSCTRLKFSSAQTGVRTPINFATAWLDLSQVYGSTEDVARRIRNFHKGQLIMGTSQNGESILPLVKDVPGCEAENESERSSTESLACAGDKRASENIMLLAIQTLFYREHNRLAKILAEDFPEYSEELLFQIAKALNIGQYQHIIFEEYLPAMLGKSTKAEPVAPTATSSGLQDFLSRFRTQSVDEVEVEDDESDGSCPAELKDYFKRVRSDADPATGHEMSNMAFRMGHSQVREDVQWADPKSGVDLYPTQSLVDTFFAAKLAQERGVDAVLKFLISNPAQEVDLKVVDSMRDLLFQGPKFRQGLDLVAQNIQRGRESGIAGYNILRCSFNLNKIASFEELTSDPAIVAELKKLYGTIDNCDPFVCGLLEPHIRSGKGSLGKLFTKMTDDNFDRWEDPDHFYYENIFKGKALEAIEGTTLASLILKNSVIHEVQRNVLKFSVSVQGYYTAKGVKKGGVHLELYEKWARYKKGGAVPAHGAGAFGSDGKKEVEFVWEKIATTVTSTHEFDAGMEGWYVFDQQFGALNTGNYEIRCKGCSYVYAFSITKGNTHIYDANMMC